MYNCPITAVVFIFVPPALSLFLFLNLSLPVTYTRFSLFERRRRSNTQHTAATAVFLLGVSRTENGLEFV